MKIAMTISGQPRQYAAGFLECKKWFLDKYDIDVYLHSWIDKKFYKYDFFDEGKLQNTYTADENTYSEILELYKPKDYLFEKAINFDATDIKGSNNQRLNSQLGMWMSLKRAWDLLEESGIKYDYVIRTRFDLQFTDHVVESCPLISNITQLNPNQVNLFDYHNDNHRKLNVNDLFAIGGYDVMKVYHNLFIDQIYYHFTDPVYDEWLIGLDKFVNETILLYHLNTYYVPFNRIPTELDKQITLNRVLLLNDEGNVLIGKPYLESVKIKGKILEHLRGKKTIVYKMRPKKKTRKKQGHRQELTRVLIEDIVIN